MILRVVEVLSCYWIQEEYRCSIISWWVGWGYSDVVCTIMSVVGNAVGTKIGNFVDEEPGGVLLYEEVVADRQQQVCKLVGVCKQIAIW